MLLFVSIEFGLAGPSRTAAIDGRRSGYGETRQRCEQESRADVTDSDRDATTLMDRRRRTHRGHGGSGCEKWWRDVATLVEEADPGVKSESLRPKTQ
ncbi:hypothetical protein HN51_038634 [Arachis hypogaea]